MNDSPKALSVVTIIPLLNQTPGRAQAVVGTKVMLSDGSELTGVTSVTLSAEPGDVWKATITVRPERVGAITAVARIIGEDNLDGSIEGSVVSSEACAGVATQDGQP